MTTLAGLLLDAGLIQFGWFASASEIVPFAPDLDMLASYPAILSQIVTEAQAVLSEVQVTRLLCPLPALPFGVAYSLSSGIPLVYSRGESQQAVFDLIGAYDIGHATLLLTNTFAGEPLPLISEARRVGLDVHTVVPILEVRPAPRRADLKVLPLLRLADVVREAVDGGRISRDHALAALDWLSK